MKKNNIREGGAQPPYGLLAPPRRGCGGLQGTRPDVRRGALLPYKCLKKVTHTRPPRILAFTLIELLIVISIITIMAFIGFSSFSISKRSLALDLETDKIISELAARRGKSQVSSICLGILFEKNAEFKKIQTPYRKNSGCDFASVREEPAPTKSPINISSIKLDNSQTNKLSVLFSPPQGKMIFRNGENAPATESQAEIIFKNNETARKLLINSTTGQITKQ